MLGKSVFLLISSVALVLSVATTFADCPSADITGDCWVDFEDFALMASQWLNTGPSVPNDIVFILGGSFEMGDHYGEGYSCELPVHWVYLDSFYMGTSAITNGQYCQYLNSALGTSIYVSEGIVYGSGNNKPYCDTHPYNSGSQIDYSCDVFIVRTKCGRDMSNDPMVWVSWYGAAAYCNWRSQQEGYQQCYDQDPCDPNWPCDFSKNGYRLPTEAEWEYAARGGEQNPYYRFPWGDTISHNQANYYSIWIESSPYYPYDMSTIEGYHPLWNDGIFPYTSPVGFFDGSLRHKSDFDWPASQSSYQTANGANGYGLYDMVGNVWELCNDWYGTDYYETSPANNPTGPPRYTRINRVSRGGSYGDGAFACRVAYRGGNRPDSRYLWSGFRVVLDLE
jgi:formylglycine-generating enzyme required for sulfatase activity